MKKRALICFVKYPEPGRVKTRLAKNTSYEFAAAFYSCCVRDLNALFEELDFPVYYFIGQGERMGEFQNWIQSKLPVKAQCEGDLGLKMSTAFKELFEKGYEEVVIIGSDCLNLDSEIFERAFNALSNSKDVVLGPSADGGYYLLGLKKDSFFPEIFQNIEWSTEQVFTQTLLKCKNANKKVTLLEEKNDIDELSDLKLFFHQNQSQPALAPLSVKFLKENPEWR